MEWFFATRTWRRMHGLTEGEDGVDEKMAARGFENIGAWILRDVRSARTASCAILKASSIASASVISSGSTGLVTM